MIYNISLLNFIIIKLVINKYRYLINILCVNKYFNGLYYTTFCNSIIEYYQSILTINKFHFEKFTIKLFIY